MSGGSARRRHPGQWVLLDARLKLLSIDDALYPGISPNVALDLDAKRVLLPRMRTAVVDGIERIAPAANANRRLITRVIPIRGAVSEEILAVLGCYGPFEVELPDPPLVGSWEWRVTPPGPHQQMRTYWSAELFTIYGIPVPDQGHVHSPVYWEGPQFFDELVVDGYRAEMRWILDEFMAETTDALRIHFYKARNFRTNEIQDMRMMRCGHVADTGEGLWFRGFSVRVKPVAVQDPLYSSRPLIDASWKLSRDPLCTIDTVYEHIYMTSENFGDLRIALPAHRHLPQMCHSEDLPRLRRMLATAVATPSQRNKPIRIRLLGESGEWTLLEFAGIGVRLSKSDSDSHHVLCRVVAVEDSS